MRAARTRSTTSRATRPLLAASLAAIAFASCGHDSKGLPNLLDPAPFHPAKELRIETGSTLDLLEIGVPVSLRWQPDGFVQYSWTLEAPPGSNASLSDPAAPSPTFVPDVAGEYRVALTTSVGPDVRATTERRLLAAAYLGQAACAVCHGDRAAATARTSHGTTLERRAEELFATTGCINCHVVGSNAARTTPAAGGFDDEAMAVGFDPSAFVDYPTFAATYRRLADLGSVQCESCHGPGSLHDGDPRWTTVSTDARVCGACHNTFGPRFKQWQLSVHAEEPPAATRTDPSCVRCHTARGFARTVNGRPVRDEGPDAPGVTCAACHDPHSAANPSEVRLFGGVTLAEGTTFLAGRAAACVTCHQSEVADAGAHAEAGGAFPCAVQAEMVAGRGAFENGADFGSSFHGDPGFKPRNLTGNPDDPLYAEACVTCHMAPTPPTGPFADQLGAHTWRMRDGAVEHAVGNCDRCHAGLDTFDRNTGRDFDGNGVAGGVQTEMRGLVENLWDALAAADTGQALSRPGGPGTFIEVLGDLTRSTPQLRQAAYNYNFVVRDGSWGVHNTVYAVQVLQRTYGFVTGVAYSTAFPLAYIA